METFAALQLTSTQERALSLLGAGQAPEVVAMALGITPSAVSQMLSQDEFASQVATLRYQNLAKHNKRDSEYDDIEDTLVAKLKESLALMFRPEQILKAVQVINAAKRRGQSTPESITQQSTVVSLTMPVQIIQKFTTNIHNQVIEAGDQKLVTVQSGTILDKIKKAQEAKLLTAGQNNETTPITNTIAALSAGEAKRLEQETGRNSTAEYSIPDL